MKLVGEKFKRNKHSQENSHLPRQKTAAATGKKRCHEEQPGGCQNNHEKEKCSTKNYQQKFFFCFPHNLCMRLVRNKMSSYKPLPLQS